MPESTTPKEHVQARPAGTTAALTTLLVLVLGWLDVELSAEEAAIVIGGLTSLVSLFTPR